MLFLKLKTTEVFFPDFFFSQFFFFFKIFKVHRCALQNTEIYSYVHCTCCMDMQVVGIVLMLKMDVDDNHKKTALTVCRKIMTTKYIQQKTTRHLQWSFSSVTCRCNKTVFAGNKAAAPHRPHPQLWHFKVEKKNGQNKIIVVFP